MNNKITDEFRAKCLQKLREMNVESLYNPENVEKKCFERADEDFTSYVNMVKSFLTRQNQITQQRNTGLMPQQSSGHNYGVSVSSGPIQGSDPLNALQNLTVTAGQSNAQLRGSMSSSPYSVVRIPGPNIRPGPMTISQQQGPPPHLSMQHHPSTQIAIQSNQQRTSAYMPMMVATAAQAPIMTTPADNNTSNLIAVSSNAQYPAGPAVNTTNPAILGPSMPPQSRPVAHPTQNLSQPSPSINPGGPGPSNGPGLIHQAGSGSTYIDPNKKPVYKPTKDEARRVAEEIKRLRDRYLTSLRMMIERATTSEDLKVWSVLRNILENPNSITKPLSMKHIPKIEQHLIRAETNLLNLEPNLAHSIRPIKTEPVNQQLPSFDMKSSPSSTHKSSEMMTSSGVTQGSNTPGPDSGGQSNLDMAFQSICSQLNTTQKRTIDALHSRIIHYVKTKQPRYSYMLPRTLVRVATAGGSGTKKMQLVDCSHANVDKEGIGSGPSAASIQELEFLSKLRSKGRLLQEEEVKEKCHLEVLCGDIDDFLLCECSCDEMDLDGEIEVLRLDPEVSLVTLDVVTDRDSLGSCSRFYSLAACPLVEGVVDESYPAIVIELPHNYNETGAVKSWRLEPHVAVQHPDQFHEMLQTQLEYLQRINQWDGLSITQLTLVYKRTLQQLKGRRGSLSRRYKDIFNSEILPLTTVG